MSNILPLGVALFVTRFVTDFRNRNSLPYIISLVQIHVRLHFIFMNVYDLCHVLSVSIMVYDQWTACDFHFIRDLFRLIKVIENLHNSAS